MLEDSYKRTVRQEVVNIIINLLKSGFEGSFCDLRNILFSMDYFHSNEKEAEEFIMKYGFFNALKEVEEYRFIDDCTEFTLNMIDEPKKFADLLKYIIGVDILTTIQIEFFEREDFDEETNKEVIEFLETLEV